MADAAVRESVDANAAAEPELTDGFAKEVGSEFESLEDLKTRIRESIQTGKQQEEEHRAKDKLVQDLVTKFDIAVPESMVKVVLEVRSPNVLP